MSDFLMWLVILLVVFAVLYWLVVIRGTDERTEKARQKLQATLMSDEKVVSSTMQNRIASLFKRRELVAITNSRFISINRSLFGGFSMRDYQWKDLRDVKSPRTFFPEYSAPISPCDRSRSWRVAHRWHSERCRIRHLCACPERGQAWEEKLRIRELEEERQAVACISIPVQPVQPAPPAVHRPAPSWRRSQSQGAAGFRRHQRHRSSRRSRRACCRAA